MRPGRDLSSLERLKDLKEGEEGLLVDPFVEPRSEAGRVPYLVEQAFPPFKVEGPADPNREVGLGDPPPPWVEVMLEMENPRGVPFALDCMLPRVEERGAVPRSSELEDAQLLAIQVDEGVIWSPPGRYCPSHPHLPRCSARLMREGW